MQRNHRKTVVTVTFEKEGVHCYPAAASIKGVEFLAHPHRHMFKFSVSVEVFHDDRDIEFILLKRELESLYTNGTLQLNSMSCEMLAQELIDYIVRTYPGRDVEVSVYEDGENGATVTDLTKDRPDAA